MTKINDSLLRWYAKNYPKKIEVTMEEWEWDWIKSIFLSNSMQTLDDKLRLDMLQITNRLFAQIKKSHI